MADPGFTATAWRLRYSGLTDEEVKAIEDLFVASEGGRETFGFLDPNSNLLRWSEDLTDTRAWGSSAHLEIVPRPTTEPPSEFEITNAGQTSGRITQLMQAPGWFEYTGSMAIRADLPCSVLVGMETAEANAWTAFTATNSWRRISVGGRLNSRSEAISFGIQIPEGYRVRVREMQVEAQPGMNEYKATGSRSGVYPRTRFAQTKLRISTHGANDHRLDIELTSRD